MLWAVVLEKTLESPLDREEIKPVNPKGNQSWIFVGRADTEAEVPILWPPDVKSRLIWKDPKAGREWRQEEKEATEDEMVGWYHWLNGHAFEQALGDGEEDGDGEGKPGVLQCMGLRRVGHDWVTELNWFSVRSLTILSLLSPVKENERKIQKHLQDVLKFIRIFFFRFLNIL